MNFVHEESKSKKKMGGGGLGERGGRGLKYVIFFLKENPIRK